MASVSEVEPCADVLQSVVTFRQLQAGDGGGGGALMSGCQLRRVIFSGSAAERDY